MDNPPENPLLSICIPTYNRATYLAQLLNTVTSLAGDHEVEIIVSDNASEDETPYTVKKFQSFCPIIRYFRNETNLGFDKNVLLAAERAKGEFVWFLADDDLLVPSCVEKIKKVIRDGHDIGLFFGNFVNVDIQTGKRTGPPGFKLTQSLHTTSPFQVFRKIGCNTWYISAIIARRDLWVSVDSKSFMGGTMAHFWYVLSIIPHHPVYLLADICHESRYLGDILPNHWSNSIEWWRLNFIESEKILRSARGNGYKPWEIWAALFSIRLWLMKSIAYFRLTHNDRLRGAFRLLWSHYRFSFFFYLAILPLYIVPRVLLAFVYYANKRVSRRHAVEGTA